MLHVSDGAPPQALGDEMERDGAEPELSPIYSELEVEPQPEFYLPRTI